MIAAEPSAASSNAGHAIASLVPVAIPRRSTSSEPVNRDVDVFPVSGVAGVAALQTIPDERHIVSVRSADVERCEIIRFHEHAGRETPTGGIHLQVDVGLPSTSRCLVVTMAEPVVHAPQTWCRTVGEICVAMMMPFSFIRGRAQVAVHGGMGPTLTRRTMCVCDLRHVGEDRTGECTR